MPRTVRESHPSRLPAIQWPDFTPPFPPSLVVWRKEEASCQRATQRVRCSAAPPAPGTSSIPKPTPQHTDLTPLKSFLPSSPVTPDQLRGPQVRSVLFIQGRGQPGTQLRFLANVRFGNSREGWPSNFHHLKMPQFGVAFQFTLQMRASAGLLLKFVQGRIKEEDGVGEINILLNTLGPLFAPDLFITCTAAV